MPQSSIKYIIYQRTGYLSNNIFFNVLSKLGSLASFYKLSVSLKAVLFSSQIRQAFCDDLENDFLMIRKYLPQNAKSILDIGCGVAGIDALISEYYKDDLGVFLIDKTVIDKKVFYDFENKGSFYNSLDISRDLLAMNHVGVKNIFLQDATEDNQINFENQFDIIISLISWGFHYPISTYLSTVYFKLNEGGVLILDVRKKTSGIREIEQQFGNCKIIHESKSYFRVIAIK